jgi:hypothetical protein
VRLDERIVTKIPLTEIWDDTGALTGERIRYLDQDTLRELVHSSCVQFIVADPGIELNWIPTEKRFEFWKTIRPQIADSTKRIYLKQFPNGVAYIAFDWRGRAGECLILLEKTSLGFYRRGSVLKFSVARAGISVEMEEPEVK